MNPLEGKKALDLMERQVEEFGAKAFKFYNVRYDYGQPFPWRMDDPRIAFPVFEKAQELGVNLIGVHKGVPLGPQPIEHTQTFDMDGAAANFPDINFVIFHVGLPFLDEVLLADHPLPEPLRVDRGDDQLHRPRQPRVFAEMLGKMLWWCGEDKIIYGGEAPIWHPQWALEAFWNFELPQDIVEERGYPQLTEQAKRKILGENLARLHGIDVEAKRRSWAHPSATASPEVNDGDWSQHVIQPAVDHTARRDTRHAVSGDRAAGVRCVRPGSHEISARNLRNPENVWTRQRVSAEPSTDLVAS